MRQLQGDTKRSRRIRILTCITHTYARRIHHDWGDVYINSGHALDKENGDPSRFGSQPSRRGLGNIDVTHYSSRKGHTYSPHDTEP
jgi:hypothetical protein